jgi:hypothetical protein
MCAPQPLVTVLLDTGLVSHSWCARRGALGPLYLEEWSITAGVPRRWHGPAAHVRFRPLYCPRRCVAVVRLGRRSCCARRWHGWHGLGVPGGQRLGRHRCALPSPAPLLPCQFNTLEAGETQLVCQPLACASCAWRTTTRRVKASAFGPSTALAFLPLVSAEITDTDLVVCARRWHGLAVSGGQ